MFLLFFLSSVFLLANQVASSSSHKCEEMAEFHQCTDMSSTKVMVPNLLSQNQSVAIKELSQYTPITGCSVHLKFFLCSIYAPSCPTKSNYPFPPCRALCKQVKTDCTQHNIRWPAALDCDRFPEEGGYCKCLSSVIEIEPKPKQKDVEIDYACQDIANGSICEEFYTQTAVPNFFNHTNQEVALAHMGKWNALTALKCSPDMRPFLCSVYFPKCGVGNLPTPPCKSLCESVHKGCKSTLNRLRFLWPQELNCRRFGEKDCVKSSQIPKDEIIVSLPSGGQIRGSSMNTWNRGLQIFAFRGIPYAQPPIGQLRFRPPVAKQLRASKKPFDATKEGPECIQVDPMMGMLMGKEDCLVLNVYTTNINQTQPEKPVMVFMHGGGFTIGSGSIGIYSPRRLLDHNVVLVTLNYRLHVFGFLSTMDEESPGNYGLLDQTEALKWVQTNIRAFGGNPNNVNIFGESAGSASVFYHMLSPLSAGLFHSVIAQSGSPLSPWGSVTDAAYRTEQFAESVGCTTKNKKKMMQCLRLMPAELLTLEMGSSSDNSLLSPFLPVVDGHFLPNSSYNSFKHGAIVNKVPVMTGVVQEEGVFVFQMLRATIAKKELEITDESLRKLIVLTVSIKEENVTKAAIDLLRKEYFHSVDPNDSDAIQEIIIKILSYSFFVAPHIQTVEFLSDHGVDTFVYSFDLVTNQSIGQFLGLKPLKNQKPSHGDELFFLFMDRSINPEVDRTEETMLQMWTKFAQFGHPTKYLENNVTEWPKSKRDDIQIYHLDNPFNVESYDRNDDRKIQFWLQDIRHALDLER